MQNRAYLAPARGRGGPHARVTPADERGAVAVSETVTEQDLRDSEAAYRAAAARADDLRSERNRTVRSALTHGWTLAEVARATGLTRGRVGQISTAGKGHAR